MLSLSRFLQLADSAFPIGATAHSLGIETLCAEGYLTVPGLLPFLMDYVAEVGAQEGLFCRLAYRLYPEPDDSFTPGWLSLNQRVSALKLAREPRKASLMMGKRFLQALTALEPHPGLLRATQAGLEAHHSCAFGLAGAHLQIEEDLVVMVYLQQASQTLVMACQKLLPLGQAQSNDILWKLKPAILAAAQKSQAADPFTSDAAFAFGGLVEMAALRHPALPMRLFIS